MPAAGRRRRSADHVRPSIDREDIIPCHHAVGYWFRHAARFFLIYYRTLVHSSALMAERRRQLTARRRQYKRRKISRSSRSSRLISWAVARISPYPPANSSIFYCRMLMTADGCFSQRCNGDRLLLICQPAASSRQKAPLIKDAIKRSFHFRTYFSAAHERFKSQPTLIFLDRPL